MPKKFAVMIGFNPRARVGRDALLRAEKAAKAMFQSTRPRGARLSDETKEVNMTVSIHAPAWGATAYWVISLKSSTKVVIFAKRKNKKENWI